MMSNVEIYSFEDEDGNEFGGFTTTDIDEAKKYARDNSLVIIANIFEYADSEIVADYTSR